MYDTETEKWTAVEPMPSKRSAIAAAAINNSFFVFGGEDPIKTYANNEEYDIKTVNGYHKNLCLLPVTDW